jgi:WD40 repeat protein
MALSAGGRLETHAGHAATSDCAVVLWDMDQETERRRFEGQTQPVLSVAFAPGGHLALSAGRDRSVRLWDVDSGGQVSRLEGHQATVESAAFAPDSRGLFSGAADGALRWWSLPRLKLLK